MQFRDSYAFLSNMYPSPIVMTERTTGKLLHFTCAEAAFQAAKCPERAREFENLTGPQAKKLGRQVSLRADWDTKRIAYMRCILKAKFTQNPELAKALRATGDIVLVEDNTWGDKFWGVCKGVGENNLGKLLMEIRAGLE